MPLANQASAAHGPVDYEVRDFLATLGAADLLQVTWPEDGMRQGFDVFIPPLCANPNTLAVGVRNRKEAFALRAAKIEIDNGNYYGGVPGDARVCATRLSRNTLSHALQSESDRRRR